MLVCACTPGSGAFGHVYTCLDEVTGHELAVKQVKIHSDAGPENLKEIQALEQEIALLQNLRHKRIVTYYGTERTKTYLSIFMEYVPGRSIHTRLREYGAFSEDVVKKYTRQVLEGLAYLHGQGIIHRDIKGKIYYALIMSALLFMLAQPLVYVVCACTVYLA